MFICSCTYTTVEWIEIINNDNSNSNYNNNGHNNNDSDIQWPETASKESSSSFKVLSTQSTSQLSISFCP